ncbi:DUF5662 family protein [Pseudobutyrivibrio xylanivorans]|nr:DUF5662 family protein [Pseudobutyrivibrio xylanivorans]
MKAWEHLKTINHHRRLVRKGCFAVGLYWQGLTHDLSKYSWVEFSVGAKYFQGDKSPNNAERAATGVSMAWLHHKGRNKHHFEYWIDYGLDEHHGMTGMEMPVRYVVEMYCDRVAACKTYQKEKYTDASALKYFEHGKAKYMMNENTKKLLEDMLTHLAEHGEEATNDYIRREILKNK